MMDLRPRRHGHVYLTPTKILETTCQICYDQQLVYPGSFITSKLPLITARGLNDSHTTGY